jgi:exopolyphosphatase/guanosine-5'-triphosphate,3'-diphosphate pyrophosphatase
MNSHKPELVASIDVGSNSIQMIIAEIYGEGQIQVLEDLWHPTNIGRDTFVHRRISVESINETVETLKGFVSLMKDYRIKRYRAIATSGIREADNREYVLDQLQTRTGLSVEVISSSQERFFIYKAMRDRLPQVKDFRYSGFLVVNIRMGGLEASVYNKGRFCFTEHIKAGPLRMRQILRDLESLTLDFPALMEEFLESKLFNLKPLIMGLDMENVIGLGGEIDTIARLCMQKKLIRDENFIGIKALEKLFNLLKGLTTDQLVYEYELHYNEAEVLLPSLIIFKKFLEMTRAKGIHIPGVSLRHGLLAELVDERLDTPRKHLFNEDIISSVWYMANRFGINYKHAQQVTKISLSVFDQIRNIHHLKARERMLLEVAAIFFQVFD